MSSASEIVAVFSLWR